MKPLIISLYVVAAAATAVSNIGCARMIRHTIAARENKSQQVTPEQLLETIRTSVEDAKVSNEMLAVDGKKFRLQVLNKNISQGTDAIELLLDHPKATPEQLSDARQAHAQLLYFGAKRNLPDFDERLGAFIQELETDFPDTKEWRVGEYYWLRWNCVDGEKSSSEALASIEDYGRRYPDSSETVSLFTRTAARLAANKDLKQADRCCELAISLLGDQPEVVATRQKIKQLMISETNRAAKEMRKQAFYRSIVVQLGGREKGYFVVYSEEKGKTRQVLCDYTVCKGAAGVESYARIALRKGWRWEHIASFPYTPDGSKAAHKKCKTLIQQNTRTVFSWGS